MRRTLLAIAALAATVAVASATSIDAAKLQRRCPDLTYNQVGTELGKLVEQYQFSNEPDEALEQAGMMLCPTAEQRAMLQKHYDAQVAPIPATSYAPPPRQVVPHGSPPPMRAYPHQVRPHVAPPPIGVRPIVVPVPLGHPRYAGAAPYAARQYSRVPHGAPEPQRQIHRKTVRGNPYCGDPSTAEGMKTFVQLNGQNPMERMPGRYLSCEPGEVPGKPCPGWVCKRAR